MPPNNWQTKFFAVIGYNAGERHEYAITYRIDKGLTLVMKNSGANTGRGPMPRVPSPARPNTPPASQRRASGKVFSPIENAQAFVPSTLVPSTPSAPAKEAKPVPFAIPKYRAVCRTYHEGGVRSLHLVPRLLRQSLDQRSKSMKPIRIPTNLRIGVSRLRSSARSRRVS